LSLFFTDYALSIDRGNTDDRMSASTAYI